MSDRHEMTHEETVDFIAAHERGVDACAANVERMLAVHRDEAVVMADLDGPQVRAERDAS